MNILGHMNSYKCSFYFVCKCHKQQSGICMCLLAVIVYDIKDYHIYNPIFILQYRISRRKIQLGESMFKYIYLHNSNSKVSLIDWKKNIYMHIFH